MDEKSESETRPDPGRRGEAAVPEEAAPAGAAPREGMTVPLDPAGEPAGPAAPRSPGAADLPAAGAADAGSAPPKAADELPEGATVPAGYVAVPVGSSTAHRAARRAVWRERWRRVLAPALVGLILGGLLGSGITALALHDSDRGPHFGPRIVHRDGPGIGPRFGPGFPGNRDGGPRLPGVPQSPQAPTPTPSQSG